ncbi:hypothetical protein KL944_002822 [Ogataea haglerorum]|nr:hypothetical protein KL944_002822 [Ogataea haglerorum]
MFEQVKERLLLLFRTGKYAQLAPAELANVYQVSKTFLRLNESKLAPLEYYTLLELHYFLCLLTTRDTEAKTALDRFSDKFEAKNSEKLVVLKSYYVEILGKKDALEYLEAAAVPLIQARPSLTAEPVQHHQKDLRQVEKRKVALKSDSPASYIKNLLEYISDTPLDYESWMELAEQYVALGEYEKAYDCVQEVLVGVPAAGAAAGDEVIYARDRALRAPHAQLVRSAGHCERLEGQEAGDSCQKQAGANRGGGPHK